MIKLEQLLAENMRRFNTKNLSEQVPGAAPAPASAKPAAQSASVPPSLTLNYDNGLLRVNQFFGKDGNLLWDINATFAGGPNGLTLTQVVLKPGNSSGVKPGAKPVAIPLMAPFTVLTPLNFKAGAANEKRFIAGIKLNTKSPGAVATGLDEMSWSNINLNLGSDIYTALANLAADKGWYTGPKQTVAKQYALFTNHDGSKDIF